MKLLLSAIVAGLLLPALPAQDRKPETPAQKLERLTKELKSLTELLKERLDLDGIRSGLQRRKAEYRVITLKKKVEPAKPAQPGMPAKPGQVETPVPPAVPDRVKAEGEVPQPRQDERADQTILGPGKPGEVLLKVSGYPVTRGEFTKLSAYLTSYQRNLPPHEVQQQAMEQLIINAFLASNFKDKLPALRKRITDIRNRIVDGGQPFAEVATECSDCPSKSNGGNLGPFGRSQMVQPFAMHAFTLKKGQISEPFLSPFGFHIIKVIKVPQGMEPARMMVEARHILVMFDKDQGRLRGLMGQARGGKVGKVEILNKGVMPIVPGHFLQQG